LAREARNEDTRAGEAKLEAWRLRGSVDQIEAD